MTTADPKLIFSTPVPLNRLEVAIHTPSEDYPLAKMGQLASNGLYEKVNQSHEKPLVLEIGSDLENSVQRE